MLSLYITAVLGVLYAVWALSCQRRRSIPPGLKKVPHVKGSWPLVGHGLVFGADIMGFVRRAVQECGPVFRVKIFLRDIIVICDRNLVHDYFKRREKDMSLYAVLTKLFFADAFSDNPETLPETITLVKSSIALRADEFIPKILEEAKLMMARIQADVSKSSTEIGKEKGIDMALEAIRFVAHTSARCFIGFSLTEEFWVALLKFTHLLNRIVVLTYFAPKPLLRLVFHRRLSQYRHAMTRIMAPEIEKYRQDPDKTDSALFRQAVDRTKLTNEQIGDVAVCLLYVSSENTALGLSAALLDLARHGEWWDKVADELRPLVDNNDARAILANSTLDACMMESARLNSHVFALNRAPQFSTTDDDDQDQVQIGSWYVGDAQVVALCEPMLMVYENAEDQFKKAQLYDPERFLPPRSESKRPEHIMTWGAGVHQCPGKLFAIFEIKTAMALMITMFEKPALPTMNIPRDYFSPSAFAEVRSQVILTPRAPQIDDTNKDKNNISNGDKNGPKIVRVPVAKGKSNAEVSVECYEGGWLLRNYLSREDQKDMYNYTCTVSANAAEHTAIAEASPSRAYPLLIHKLVYTGESNCTTEPTRWFSVGEDVWEFLGTNSQQLGWNEGNVNGENGKYGFDSVYAQLFGPEGKMDLHCDEHVTWGVSVSLGASCTFRFGSRDIMLHSGDVFVADFSKTMHGVLAVHDNTVPGWWEEVQTFGRVRCSVQIRNVSRVEQNVKQITPGAFRELIGAPPPAPVQNNHL